MFKIGWMCVCTHVLITHQRSKYRIINMTTHRKFILLKKRGKNQAIKRCMLFKKTQFKCLKLFLLRTTKTILYLKKKKLIEFLDSLSTCHWYNGLALSFYVLCLHYSYLFLTVYFLYTFYFFNELHLLIIIFVKKSHL